ncbi:MAG: class I SAM-dependent methyltransferase [Acidobacteriaceae bacterium]|nr:class I SAM-dependent methyltransferase [Acidobacteriaceae bacterium]
MRHVLDLDAYSAAKAFVDGRFDVRGDLIEAIRYFSNQPHSGTRQLIFSMLARLEHLRIHSFFDGSEENEKNTRYHYNHPNEFYSLFLDSRLVYSAGWFDSPYDTLDQAQGKKFELICRDLRMRPDDTFLDVGSGWGGLILYAAGHFGAFARGCTIATQQLRWTKRQIEEQGLRGRVDVCLCDYREMHGLFDKIASVGMFEHVGKNKLGSYFRKMYSLLRPGGLFLNSGVMRPKGVNDGPETLFVQRSVLPGGELVRLDDVLLEAERAGFENVGMRDLSKHYARTCEAWVKNLQRNKDRCCALVGERTYRTWLLYLAGSAVSFEEGNTSAAQVVLQKPRT